MFQCFCQWLFSSYVWLWCFITMWRAHDLLPPSCLHLLLSLIYWWTSVMFSIMAVPIYFSANSAQGVSILHILFNSCYFLFFENEQVWGDIALGLWFAYSWQLVMLSIYSCAWWPSVGLLLKKISIQFLCPFFNWVICFVFNTSLLEYNYFTMLC